jgi:hypothetical protein
MKISHNLLSARASVQGNCTEPEPGLIRGPPRMTDRQCVLSIEEDWLVQEAPNSAAWVSDLYVQVFFLLHLLSSQHSLAVLQSLSEHDCNGITDKCGAASGCEEVTYIP